MKVGFIGLGIMGSRMAANLQQAGHELVVYNRTRAKAEPLLSEGAAWADSPAEAAHQAPVLVTMLSTPQVVADLALGEDGFLQAMQTDGVWINATTVNPSFSREIAQAAQAHQVRFVEAPVAGTKGPAQQGELLFLVSAPQALVDEIHPLLEVMGRKVVHFEEYGQASSMKMVLNLLLGQAMLAFAEALALGQSLGLSQQRLLDTLIGGPVAAPFLAAKGQKIAAGDFEADFPLQWMRKDLELAAQSAYEQGTALPSANLAKELYALAEQQGLAGADFSAIYQFFQKQNGG